MSAHVLQFRPRLTRFQRLCVYVEAIIILTVLVYEVFCEKDWS